MMNRRKDLDAKLAQMQQRARTTQGRQYWRTVEEFCDLPEFEELMRQEFPASADVWPDNLSRRRFLTLMGASLALAGLGGCSVQPAPTTEIVPYVHGPEYVTPGRPLFVATAMQRPGGAIGLLVENHEGRPTKIEGNPNHPASLGATDIYAQAEVLTLYDPDRAKVVTRRGDTRTWSEAGRMIREVLERHRETGGRGFRLLTQSTTSPSFGQQIRGLLEQFPEARWHQYEPVHDDAALRASKWAFGRPVTAVYNFFEADRVLSIDEDFLVAPPGSLRYTDQFMARRRVRTTVENAESAEMNRMFILETFVTSTGAKSDHHLALRPHEIERITHAIAHRLGLPVEDPVLESEHHRIWVETVAKELQEHSSRSLVVPGKGQPAEIHLLAHAMNEKLGSVGETLHYIPRVDIEPVEQIGSLRILVEGMRQGEVETLFILGGNPVYDAPADLEFARALEEVPLRVHASVYANETSLLCDWHLPEAHFLESWGDVRCFDGAASVAQPLILPLHQGRSLLELVAQMKDGRDSYGRELVRASWHEYWESTEQEMDFETFWETSLHDGLIAGTTFEPLSVSLQEGWEEHLKPKPASEAKKHSETDVLDVVFRPDPMIFDGRYANNAWLQELPKPITRLTWDNAVILSPRTARELGLSWISYAHGGEHGGYEMPVVELELGGRTIRGPIWVMPGHADGAATLSLGYGRWHAGRVGGNDQESVGFDAYALRTSEHPWAASGAKLTKTGETAMVACVQGHHLMEGGEFVQSATLEEYQKKPKEVIKSPLEEVEKEAHRAEGPLTLYDPFDYEPPQHRWGMSIDLTTCIGCQACVIACQAENNIPVVGKEQVLAGREMHWLRVDRYITGTPELPEEFHFQPVPCMHCEHAPCEYVCPVEATVHSAEGLNDMLYQRCVGTRFCSNNCPYKVRRFNFLQYAEWEDPLRRLQYNPDVTVRSRGVMEKCTYCVQRIRHAEINADTQSRPIRDGEILTACQAACPAKAIVFGDINDETSTVRAWKETPLNYGLLAHLGTEPRTTYLGALYNPNTELKKLGPEPPRPEEKHSFDVARREQTGNIPDERQA